MNSKVTKNLKHSLRLLPLVAVLGFAWPLSSAAQRGLDSIAEIPLVAIGPASYSDSKLTVNGQIIVRDGQTTIESESGPRPSRVRQGAYVAVAGDVLEPGKALATSIVVLDEEYVDGASPTYLRAMIDNITSSGLAYSANTTVDITPSLFQPEIANIANGDLVEFTGFNSNDLMVATNGLMLGNTTSISSGRLGSEVAAIRGSGARAIRGSGARAIRGSGARAIRGSGARAIRGSGARAIRGSGARAIRGSGARAIRGSGARAIRGSGARAIRGSGLR